MPDQEARIRADILRMLRAQGYRVRNRQLVPPDLTSKDAVRSLQTLAIRHRIQEAEAGLRRYEDRLLRFIASGRDIDPSRVEPRLVPVRRDSEEELLFRYAALHWTIPVSSGYGRRLRFLVMDGFNGKLIGILGLGDPVYSLGDRDRWIGWSSDAKRSALYHVMDAYVLGAVPPYSRLLCGKLVAMLALSAEVRSEFASRYSSHVTRIGGHERPAHLAMVTTTSALGRSSIYNRIRIGKTQYWYPIGWTVGSGEFHFCNGVYDSVSKFAQQFCIPTAKNPAWGTGFRNKREVIKKCLRTLGLSDSLLYHGVLRQIFAAPLGPNSRAFLRGEVPEFQPFDWSAADLGRLFIDRWLLGRSTRVTDYRTFDPETYRIWPAGSSTRTLGVAGTT